MVSTKSPKKKPSEKPAPAATVDESKARKRAKSKGGDGRVSALDAAAKVLADTGKPMGCGDMVKAMLAKGLWNTDGKTPAATLYSAILREITKKAKESRFRKIERGKFALAK